jgi:hypothetical protein
LVLRKKSVNKVVYRQVSNKTIFFNNFKKRPLMKPRGAVEVIMILCFAGFLAMGGIEDVLPNAYSWIAQYLGIGYLVVSFTMFLMSGRGVGLEEEQDLWHW